MFKIKTLLAAILLCLSLMSGIRSQTIQELSFFAPLISTFELKYINNHLMISQQGLKVFSVTNLFDPQLVGQSVYPGNIAHQLEVREDRAYMGYGSNGIFAVYDITNINNPVPTGTVNIPATAFYTDGDMRAYGNIVYGSANDTLYVIDATVPALPVVANRVALPDVGFNGLSDIVINNNTLYVKATNSVKVLNILNPLTPVYVTSISDLHFTHRGIEVDSINNKLFLPWKTALVEFMGHDTYDISNPLAPVYMFSDSIPSNSGEFGVTGFYRDILYISHGGRVEAFSVSPSTHGHLTTHTGQNVANSTVSIEIKDSVFFNGKRGGFEVLRYMGPFPTGVSKNNSNIGQNSVSIYSNYGTKQLVISGLGNGTTEIIIYNILGQKIYSETNVELSNGSQKIIPLNNFTSGIYFTMIRSNDKIVTQKFVLQ